MATSSGKMAVVRDACRQYTVIQRDSCTRIHYFCQAPAGEAPWHEHHQ
jgi:hypothetical protein